MNPSDLIIPLLLAGAAACGHRAPGQRLRRPNPRARRTVSPSCST